MIGENIRKAMENKGMTSVDLAKAIGVTPTYISYLLNNKRTASVELLSKIAHVLNVKVSDFFEDESKGASVLYEKIFKDLVKLYQVFEQTHDENVSEAINSLENLAVEAYGLLEKFNKAKFISNNDTEMKATINEANQQIKPLLNFYENMRKRIAYILDDDLNKVEISEFTDPEDALKFILKQPALMAYGGYDLNSLTDEEILEIANDMLFAMKLSIEKLKKKK